MATTLNSKTVEGFVNHLSVDSKLYGLSTLGTLSLRGDTWDGSSNYRILMPDPVDFSHRVKGSASGYHKIKINSKNNWMTTFTIRAYQNYVYTDITISGYNYGDSHWYSPKAVMIGSSSATAVTVSFGYDADYELWVAIPANNYYGVRVLDVVNGYVEFDSVHELFTISTVSSLSGTVQETQTVYRPWYRNETVTNATNAANATVATTAGKFTDAATIKLTGDVTGEVSSQHGWTITTAVGNDSHNHQKLTGWADTRNATTTPNDYNALFWPRGIKTTTGIGTTDGSNYVSVIGFRGWSDKSGGNAHELGFTGNGNLYHRHGAETTWNAWSVIPMASGLSIGSGVVPTYLSDGKIVASNSTVGSTIRPVYMNAGTITQISYDIDVANATNTSSKIFLIGATAQGRYKTTGSHDTTYVDASAGLHSTTMTVGENVTLQYNSTKKSLDFVFA